MKNFERKLKTTAIIFSCVLAFGTLSYAQSINDDLKTREKSVKSETKTKTKTVKKTSSTRSVKKTSGTKSKSFVNPRTVPVAASETPDQVLTRFMSFRQTAEVTDRNWKSVLTQTAKTLKDNPSHSIAKAQSLIAQGQIAYNKGSYLDAINNFKAALQILPQSSLPHYSLGRAYLANGQAKNAETSFKSAIERNENFALAYKGLGDAFAAQGETKTATKYFKKATETGAREGNKAF